MRRIEIRVGLVVCLALLLVAMSPVAQGQVKASKQKPMPVAEGQDRMSGTTLSEIDFKEFRVVADRGNEIEIEVTYAYSGAFGDNVAIGARMAHDGEASPYATFRPGGVSVGPRQTTRVILSTNSSAPESLVTDQIMLQMYVGGGYVFLEEIFHFEKTWAPTAEASPVGSKPGR
jgi:hypothetical protein